MRTSHSSSRVKYLSLLILNSKFPQGDPDKDTYLLDGVVCGADTLPGNSGDFGLGLTAVHEVGHWLGLFHTFESHDEEDGCTGFGDLVFDTPAEASSASGCDVGRDTCKGKQAYGGISGIPGSMEGPDPVHNYMDYSDDACITEFTPGQIERMHELWTSLRFAPPAAPAPSNGTVTPNVTTVDRHDHPRRVARLF
jgi:hypothetical protein